MYPCFVCKLHSCINVRILEGEIRHDTAHHSDSLHSFSSRFSSVVVTITRNAAVWILQICNFLQSSEKIYTSSYFYQFINFILSPKGCTFLT